VLSTQQVRGKIETTQNIKARTRNADGRDRMVVHSTIVELATCRLRRHHGEAESKRKTHLVIATGASFQTMAVAEELEPARPA